jgi:hypothetical protein
VCALSRGEAHRTKTRPPKLAPGLGPAGAGNPGAGAGHTTRELAPETAGGWPGLKQLAADRSVFVRSCVDVEIIIGRIVDNVQNLPSGGMDTP